MWQVETKIETEQLPSVWKMLLSPTYLSANLFSVKPRRGRVLGDPVRKVASPPPAALQRVPLPPPVDIEEEVGDA